MSTIRRMIVCTLIVCASLASQASGTPFGAQDAPTRPELNAAACVGEYEIQPGHMIVVTFTPDDDRVLLLDTTGLNFAYAAPVGDPDIRFVCDDAGRLPREPGT